MQNKYNIICTSETIDLNLNLIKEYTDADVVDIYILNHSEIDFLLEFEANIISTDLTLNNLTDLTINENYQLFEKILLK